MKTRLSVLFAFGLAACRGNAETPAPPVDPGVEVGRENIVIAALGTLRSGPAISGTLAAERAATLRAEVSGSVLEVMVEQGQPVARGQPLLRIDDAAIRDGYQAARSALRAAELSADLARRNAERAAALAQAGAIAERDLETARWNETSAAAQLADARTRLAQAEQQLARTVVRAPFAGVVSERPVNAGDVVQVGTALVTVVDPSRLKLEAAVPAGRLERLTAGAPVEFTVAGLEGKTFSGRVARINPAVDPATRQIRITVQVPNPGGRLFVGLFAQGRVALAATTGIAVPSRAVDERGITPSVLRLRASRVERVPVGLGVRDEIAEQVEIVSGVSAGDTLLVGTAPGIAEGSVVRVVGEGSPVNGQR
ncbi:MAG TPA: efflux RND transporter periplasmic adaptor subunit [Gemmatimonadales bacterium]|jgi:RND family efflux transporter MFP subunit|nr:efflux RND transporter periplasmic adaptor subunit [Gemmatimonadales bacterium]